MTTATDTRMEAAPTESEVAGDAQLGWYLYGITRRAPSEEVLADVDTTLEPEPLQLLECGGLAAVVRAVPLAEFNMDVMKERLRDASAVETMVRSHNRVIDALHARRAILPAKFGVVYANVRDIMSALRAGCDSFLPQLHHLEGCDEWAVHLYADRAVVRDRVAARIPAIARLRDELATARPGRAYFLERQLRDGMESATRQALATLAQGAFDRLVASVVAGQANRVARGADANDHVEILRASFLVARDAIDRFEAELGAVSDASEGLRSECSGPWAPYSFAVCNVEGAQ